jgi:hypothetical protein
MDQIARVENSPDQSDRTMGMGSYEDLETACELTGITVDEYIRIAQTPERNLSDSELASKFAVDDLLLQPYVDEQGKVKPGTYIGKYNSIRECERLFNIGHKSLQSYIDNGKIKNNLLFYTYKIDEL